MISTLLIYKSFIALLITVLTTGFFGFVYQANGAVGGGESGLDSPSPSFQILNLTLRGALTAAVESNPDVLLYKEQIEAARGQVRTQLGAMLPNISSNVRQSTQTVFRGSFGLTRNAPGQRV